MRRLLPLVVPALVIVLWQALTASGVVDVLFLPEPAAVVRSLARGVATGELLGHAGATIRRAFLGFAISLLAGVPSGVLVGRAYIASRLLEPTIDFLRSIPPTAFLPLFLLVFGLGDAPKLATVVYGCSFVVLVNVAYGARHVLVLRQSAARMLGLSRMQRLAWIVLPEASPHVFSAARVSASLALMLVVVSEMFGGTSRGLGFAIIDAGNRYAMPDCYAAIVLTGVIGYAASQLLVRVERRVLHWAGK